MEDVAGTEGVHRLHGHDGHLYGGTVLMGENGVAVSGDGDAAQTVAAQAVNQLCLVSAAGWVEVVRADGVIDQRQQFLQPLLPTAAIQHYRDVERPGPTGQLYRLRQEVAVQHEDVCILQQRFVDRVTAEFTQVGIGVDDTAFAGGQVHEDGGEDRRSPGLVGAVDKVHLLVGEVHLWHVGERVAAETADQGGLVAKGGKGHSRVGGRAAGKRHLPLCLELLVVARVMGQVIDDVGRGQAEEESFVHGRARLVEGSGTFSASATIAGTKRKTTGAGDVLVLGRCAAAQWIGPDTAGRTACLDDCNDAAGLLVLFICNHCPTIKHVRFELVAIGCDYQARSIAVMAINSNDGDAST